MKYVILALVLSGCASTPATFFGGQQRGAYVKQFHGQLLCSYVSGWAPEPTELVCLCTLTDPNFSPDKTFIKAPLNALCDKDLNLK